MKKASRCDWLDLSEINQAEERLFETMRADLGIEPAGPGLPDHRLPDVVRRHGHPRLPQLVMAPGACQRDDMMTLATASLPGFGRLTLQTRVCLLFLAGAFCATGESNRINRIIRDMSLSHFVSNRNGACEHLAEPSAQVKDGFKEGTAQPEGEVAPIPCIVLNIRSGPFQVSEPVECRGKIERWGEQ